MILPHRNCWHRGALMRTDSTGHVVTATTEEITVYNMLLTEAIFELLADKGILTREDVKERIQKLKNETHLNISRVQ